MAKETINVIIIEDDDDAANIYKQFTDQMERFHVIATASSGEQALQLLKVIQPQLLLLDVFLPDMNGIDLLREIRKQYRGIDVILITAANDTETVSEAIRGGAFGYLVKPIIVDKLIATLKEYKDVRGQLHQEQVVNQEKLDVYFRKNQPQSIVDEPTKRDLSERNRQTYAEIGQDDDSGYRRQFKCG